MTGDAPLGTGEFGWLLRAKYGVVAAIAGWFAGWLVCFPFEFFVARRYVDGNLQLLPTALAKGLVVWGGFSLFMAMAGFVPLILPVVMLMPPRWVVRWRRLLIPAAPLAALVAIDKRMGFLHVYTIRHSEQMRAFFFTAPNFFVITFGLVVVWVYVALAKRRLRLNSR
jgi:hypothetical protein